MAFEPRFQMFRILAPEYDPALYRAVFRYAFDDSLSFEEIWEFDPDAYGFDAPVSSESIYPLLAHAAIAIATSYYKLSPTPRIICEHLVLTDGARQFWKRFYTLGLGEYLYRNEFDPSIIGEFESGTEAPTYSPVILDVPDRALVPMGGGKDSIVSVEAVRALGLNAEIVTIGRAPNPLHLSVIERTGYAHRFVRRTIDPHLIELSKSGEWPNGHVPVTGMFHFALLVLAGLTGTKHIVFSNERSAEEGNMYWRGITVNHQYSKSGDFERAFQIYAREEIRTNLTAWSLLRGLDEGSIVRKFAILTRYHDVFSSCNRNFHLAGSRLDPHERWCGICPKCAFVFLMLSAHLPSVEVVRIF
ncbi:MAG TPA: hypothetical protein PK765_05220 [bacterium]|nr:hypothetical protein [bacterium]